MNGKHYTKRRNSSFSFRFLMTVICIIAVIMVTVYFIGAQFRPEPEDTSGANDTAQSEAATFPDYGSHLSTESAAESDGVQYYISIDYMIPGLITPDDDETQKTPPVTGGQTDSGQGIDHGIGGGSLKPISFRTEPDEPVSVTHIHSWTERTCTDHAYCEICGEIGEGELGHNWSRATCVEPAVCRRCGEVGDVSESHEWTSATCTGPKTCSVCGTTTGEALGHKWKDATCTTPKTCSRCGKESGDLAPHEWKAATCTKPKTCSVCGKESGEALGHDWKAATCTRPKTCTRCGKESGDAPGHKWTSATTTSPSKCSVCGITKGDRLPSPVKVAPFSYTEEEYDLLARLIFVEAGSRSRDAMMAVGAVVMNRVRHAGFGSTVTAVINAPGQFPAKNLYNVDPPEACYAAAKACLEGELYDGEVLYFRAATSSTSWSVRKYQFTVGDNFFYT